MRTGTRPEGGEAYRCQEGLLAHPTDPSGYLPSSFSFRETRLATFLKFPREFFPRHKRAVNRKKISSRCCLVAKINFRNSAIQTKCKDAVSCRKAVDDPLDGDNALWLHLERGRCMSTMFRQNVHNRPLTKPFGPDSSPSGNLLPKIFKIVMAVDRKSVV